MNQNGKRMAWATEKPTEPGEYVFREGASVQGTTVVIHLRTFDKQLYTITRNPRGGTRLQLREAWEAGWWYGPLPE